MSVAFGGPQVLGTIAFVILWIGILVCGPAFFFFFHKDIQPVRARSPVLVSISFVCFMGMSIHYYIGSLIGQQCVLDVWLGPIFGWGLSFSYLVRTMRLLWIFNLTKYKLDENVEELKASKWKLWKNESMIKDKSLFCLWACIYFGFFIFPIAATLQGVTSSVKDGACISVANNAGSILCVIFLVIMFIVVAVKLAKVHDGYFLKNEFKAIGIMELVYGIPLIIVNFLFAKDTAEWGPALYLIEICYAFYVTFVVPSRLALTNYLEESGNSSASLSESTSKSSNKSNTIFADNTTEEVSSTPQSVDIFPGHPKVEKLIKDKLISYKFIQEYLIHYQDMKMGAYFLFWNQIYEFRNTKEQQQLAGKAYLLFQKYLKQNAYRHIDCCPNTLIVKMEEKLTEATKEDATEQIRNNFFDEAVAIVEGLMVEELFKPFFSSEYFKQYKEAARLQVGMNQVVLSKV